MGIQAQREGLQQSFEQYLDTKRVEPKSDRIPSPTRLIQPTVLPIDASNVDTVVQEHEQAPTGIKARLKRMPVVGRLLTLGMAWMVADKTRQELSNIHQSLFQDIVSVHQALQTYHDTMIREFRFVQESRTVLTYFNRQNNHARAELRRELNALGQRLAVLEHQVGQGELNPMALSPFVAARLPFDYQYDVLKTKACDSPADTHTYAGYRSVIQKAVGETACPIVVDLGCGLGAFMHFGQAQHWQMKGVDHNPLCVKDCHDDGFTDVKEQDIFAYLSEQPRASVGAVLGLGLLPELTQAQTLSLFTLVHSMLKSGGVLIVDCQSSVSWNQPVKVEDVFHMLRWVGFSTLGQIEVHNASAVYAKK